MPNAFTNMSQYLQHVRSLPDVRLSDQEAVELLLEGKREEVFDSLMKIVPFVVQRYVDDAFRRENYEDMVQEGNLAVWQCIDTWKPGGGMSLASWAFMYARKAVIREVRKDIKYLKHHLHKEFEEDVDSRDTDNEHTDEGAWEDAQQALAVYRGLRSRLQDRDKVILATKIAGPGDYTAHIRTTGFSKDSLHERTHLVRICSL